MDIMRLKQRLIACPFLGKRLFYKVIIKSEGGEQASATLRLIMKEKHKVNVGMWTYGGCFEPTVNLGGTVFIGKYCSFASHVRYFGGNHPMEYASMSPYFYRKRFGFDVKDIERSTLHVGNDVWCGYGVIITKGCKRIGNGSVIAAGSVVTHDVPPYAIVAGNPARVLRYRFDQETIDLLEESCWWELPPEKLMKHYDVIDKPQDFARQIKYNNLTERDSRVST